MAIEAPFLIKGRTSPLKKASADPVSSATTALAN
jgi:hypothetical protein